MAETPVQGKKSAAQEAEFLVNGPRRASYDRPLRNFRRTAHILQGLLEHKLAPGEYISPQDVALIMVGVKLAREAFRHTHDNLVDGIGYLLCLENIWEDLTEGYEEGEEGVATVGLPVPWPPRVPAAGAPQGVTAEGTSWEAAPLDGGRVVTGFEAAPRHDLLRRH